MMSSRACTALLALALATPALASDWPHWRGPARTGISSEKGWQSELPAAGPKVLWKANVGMGFSSVTVANGRAYTQGNKDDQDTVYCFDAATGKEVWKFSYAHPLDPKYYEGGTSATPTVDGDRVYTVSKRGHVHCFDAATGAVKWKKQLAEEVGDKMHTWGYAGSVLVDGPRAVVNIGTYGTALDKNTGAVLWKTGTGGSGYSSLLPVEQDGQKLYLVFALKELAAIKPDSGAKVWSQKWETEYDVNAADPVLVGPNRVFIASGYERGCALVEIKGGQPSIVWENKNIRSQMNAAVYHEGHLYGIDGNAGKAQLRCVEAATGKVVWTFKDPNHGALTLADGKLIVIGEKGELFIGKASPEPFKPSARAQVGGGKFWTVPVLANGRLYIRSAKGDVTCLDLSGS